MDSKRILLISILSMLPGISAASVFSQVYVLTDNSYYSYNYADWVDGVGDVMVTDRSTLTGSLFVEIDASYTVTIDYSNVLLDGSPFRANDTLITDADGVSSMTLTSGFTGEEDYISYGNASLTPFPSICVECGYEMTLNLAANSSTGYPLVLSYHESNPYDTGEAHFELYVSQVPLPAGVWLFGSGLLGLFGMARRGKS